MRLTVERAAFHGANAGRKLGKWSAEDVLAALLIGFSIFTIILGVISPDQYDNAYESAQDARRLWRQETRTRQSSVPGAQVHSDLVFLFLMLVAAILLTIALLVRTHTCDEAPVLQDVLKPTRAVRCPRRKSHAIKRMRS